MILDAASMVLTGACATDGPLKAYRHLNGLSPEGIEGANDSLRVMAESILRAKVAHSCAAAPCIDVLGELMVVVVM